MFLTRVLENKSVIRAFGVGLVLAPVVNTLTKMSTLNGVSNKWTAEMFFRIIAAGSIFNQLLYIATIAIGFLMLRGAKSAWKWTLIVLGGYIALQVSDFKHTKSSGLTWTFFLTNIAFFIFIADQLVFKVEPLKPKAQPKVKPNTIADPKIESLKMTVAKTTEKPVAHKLVPAQIPSEPGKVVALVPKVQAKAATRKIPHVRKKILFQFADQKNPWGQLVSVSSKGLQIKGISVPPEAISEREVELVLTEGLHIKTKLSMKNEDLYFFDYADLSKDKAKELNRWLSSLQNSKAV